MTGTFVPQSPERVDRRRLGAGAGAGRAVPGDGPPQPRPALAPTWRLAVLVAAVGVGHFVVTSLTHSPAAGWILLGLDAACLAGAVVDARRLPVPAQLVGTRRTPRMWSLGVTEAMVVSVANTSARAVSGRLYLPLPHPLVTGTDAVGVTIAPGAYTSATFEVTGTRRGRHEVEPLLLEVTSPLGLMRRRYAVCPADVVSVYPNLHEARRLELGVRQRREDVGMRRAKVLGIGTDFESLREYRPDDDFRLIDWHATARKQTPVARQYRIERNQSVVFLVDTGRLMAAPAGPIRRLDAALNAAIAMAFACGRLDDRVGLVAFDERVHTRIPPARNKTDLILAAMCTMEPRRVESDYAIAFRVAGGMKRSLIVLFTDLLDASASRRLLDAVPALARHHLVVVASVLDPDFDRVLGSDPATVAAAFEQSVALDLEAGHRLVVASLRRLGVEVVEAPLERFSASLVDAYLRLKAHARL